MNQPRQTPRRIAVPLLGTRIAPRLCHAQDLLIVSTADGEVGERQQINVGESGGVWAFVDWFCRQQIDLVLCCGVNAQAQKTLNARGVEVVSGLTGEAEEVVSEYLTGTLEPPTWGDPARCTRRHRHGAGKGRRRGGQRGRGGPPAGAGRSGR